jgi:hypothetical protein
MTAYVLVQLGSIAAVVFVAAVALRRYKSGTDSAVRAALDGMDATAAEILGERNGGGSRIPEPGLNGHHTVADHHPATT